MTDQEQTERGASAVEQAYRDWVGQVSGESMHGPSWRGAFEAGAASQYRQINHLRADLERVTAELAESKALAADRFDRLLMSDRAWSDVQIELAALKTERDAMREVVNIVRDHASPTIKHLLPLAWHPLCDAIARLDATRKATAEHLLPERGPGYDPLCQCGQGQLHRRRLHDTATADVTEEGK